jgi:CRP-like cAMP-binding protein
MTLLSPPESSECRDLVAHIDSSASPQPVIHITAGHTVIPQHRTTGVRIVPQPSTGKLSPDLYQALHGIKSVKIYSKGSTLFRRGMAVNGLYVIDSGRVRILLPTPHGPQLLELGGPGTVLGLSETMSGDDYRVTAQAEDHVTASFVPRDSFVEFLRLNCDYCMQVVRLLSEDLHGLYHKFRSISARPGRPRRFRPDEELN